jgi:hypothetical protein
MFYEQLLWAQIPKVQNITNNLTFFLLLGSLLVKDEHQTLMKLTPVVNFINGLQSTFAPKFIHQKLHCKTVIIEKLHKALSYETGIRKIMMKFFTPA